MAAATTSMVVVAFVLPLAFLLRDLATQRAVTKAVLESQSLVSVLAAVDSGARPGVVESLRAHTTDEVSVFLPDGTVLGRPAQADSGVAEAMRGHALTRHRNGGREVLAPLVTGDRQTLVVRVTASKASLRHGVGQAWLLLAIVAFALVIIAVVVADRLARSMLRPVEGLVRTAKQLESGQLDARASPGGPPEVAAVAHALNGLAQRILDLIADERESLADLSHRLRTPLTALRLEADTLPDPVAAERMGSAVDGLADAVDDLIGRARQGTTSAGEPTDVAVVVADRAEFWSTLAEDQGRYVGLAVESGLPPVFVAPANLADALDAVLGNVFAHTPEGTGFRIELHGLGDQVQILVDDMGPGFAHDDVLERGVSRAGSTGLGLDICRRVAASAGGTVRLDRSAFGGGRVEIRFPAAVDRLTTFPKSR
jgi:signal transduction histidine kinase